MLDAITIRRPDDFHVHFRSGLMLADVAPETAKQFARALVMPNVPAIEDVTRADEYSCEIACATSKYGFTPLMTIKLTHRTTPGLIRHARLSGVVAAKLYPEGATTASHDGVSDVPAMAEVFSAMQDCGMVLCVHGEDPSAFVLEREERYLRWLRWIVRNHPGLKVVLEHITTEAAVDFVCNASVNVAATITAHHLATTLDDVIGDGVRPHLYCKPVPKTPRDRAELVTAAIHQNGGRFFFGSDSAPHLRRDKESACGCAGVFSAPVAMSVLTDVFLDRDATSSAVKRLQAFTSEIGADFYGLPRNKEIVKLTRASWVAPTLVGGVVPFRAGQEMAWRFDGVIGQGTES